jgi:hypothetical protein
MMQRAVRDAIAPASEDASSSARANVEVPIRTDKEIAEKLDAQRFAAERPRGPTGSPRSPPF